jgi:hypothetical protein
MAIHKDTVEALLAKHGVEFTVEHSGYFDPHGGASRSVYFKTASGTIRLSDHDCIRHEGRGYLFYSDTPARAEQVVCEVAGIDIPAETVAALRDEAAARLAIEEEKAAAAAAARRSAIDEMLTAFGFGNLAGRPDGDRDRNRVLGSLAARSRRKDVLGGRAAEFSRRYPGFKYDPAELGFRF